MDIFKRLWSQILLDLRELEGDYRASNLLVDKAQNIVYMIIASLGVLGMLAVDLLVYADAPRKVWQMVACRGGFILFTVLVTFAINRTSRVRVFDRLVLGWTLVVIMALFLLDFSYSANYQTAVFDIIAIFAVYVLSPLTFQQNLFLAMCISAGTLLIRFFLNDDIEPVGLMVITVAQFIVHTLGIGAALQLHSYRRRSFKALIEERDAKEMVAYLANIDPLTKSLTRRHFFNIAESEFKRYVRYHRPFSVLMLDADGFKTINDSYGHHAGDVVLRSLSLVAMEQKRVQDTFGRLGGEEFGLILPETTLEQARVVAERMRRVWEQTPSTMDGQLIHSTISVGVAEVGADDQSFDQVLRRADLLMYKAKEQGRNRVAAE